MTQVKTRKPTAKATTPKAAPKRKATTPKATAKASTTLTAKQRDLIYSSKGAATGEHHVVTNVAGDAVIIPPHIYALVQAQCAVGQSFTTLQSAVAKAKAARPAKLANGVTGRNAPNAAKCVADNAAKAKASKPAAKSTKAAPKAAPKAKGAKAAPKASKPAKGQPRTYSVTGELPDARAGTWRAYMCATIAAHTCTAKAQTACDNGKEFRGKKLDFAWCARKNGGFITFA